MLNQQDRDWVKAMIKEATTETLNASRDFARGRVDAHSAACPNLARLKWMLLGLGIGIGASAPDLLKGLVSAFGG